MALHMSRRSVPHDVVGGARVRAMREALGLSQDALAVRAGVSRPVISRVEAGSQDVPVGTLRLLARALGVSWDDLLGPAA